MLGVNQVNIFGASGHQVSNVMQDARARIMGGNIVFRIVDNDHV
jgi:hypothetical protein